MDNLERNRQQWSHKTQDEDTIYVGHHSTQTNANNENKTSVLQTIIILVYLY